MNVIYSKLIDQVINLAKLYDIQTKEIVEGWSEVKKVIYMDKILDAELEGEILKIKGLRMWQIDPTPHNVSEKGFTDDEEKIAICFPA